MRELAIRVMTRADLDRAVDWAAAEGWNPGRHDADCFHAADPGGFLVGVLAGEAVTCISVVAYDDAFGFLGFYIARPELRGRGYGLATWRAGMARLGERNIGLDGVVAQQANYVKSGFTLAYRNVRYGADRIDAEPSDATAGTLVPIGDVQPATLQRYDRAMFPAPRERFLTCWTTRPGTVALGLLRDGKLAGYGAIRPARAGFKIGPLFADDARGAQALFAALTAGVGPIVLDVPEPNREAAALAERHRMTPVFETARMYTKAPPPIAVDRVFGVTSFELG